MATYSTTVRWLTVNKLNWLAQTINVDVLVAAENNESALQSSRQHLWRQRPLRLDIHETLARWQHDQLRLTRTKHLYSQHSTTNTSSVDSTLILQRLTDTSISHTTYRPNWSNTCDHSSRIRFLRFFENSKKRDFLRFFEVSCQKT